MCPVPSDPAGIVFAVGFIVLLGDKFQSDNILAVGFQKRRFVRTERIVKRLSQESPTNSSRRSIPVCR